MLIDIYNEPCKVTQLGKSDINDIMDLTDNKIKLREDIVVIYYYGEIRLIGLNKDTNHFEIFNLPQRFENVLRNIECFCFNESNIITLLDSQFEEMDFYFTNGTYTFDSNEHIMYYIIP
jgi:hypothetical protein